MIAEDIAILRSARELITDRKRWTHGYAARNAQSRSTDPLDAAACRWCAVGALHRQAWLATYPLSSARHVTVGRLCDHLDAVAADEYRDLIELHADKSLVNAARVNDYGGHKATLALFDAAIALAEKEGA